ncbi:hypothetical protein MMC14_010551 [Varicellaria rhodocarpa]|nr:hypothetical protein [Varicellaria rhodocarpa]
MGFSLLSCCAPPKSAIELDDADTQAPRPVKINIVEKVSLRSRRDVSLSYLKEDNILLENKEIQAMEKESLDLSIAEEQESIFELKNEKLLEKRSRGWRQQPKSEKLAGRKDLGSKNSCPYSRSLLLATSEPLNLSDELHRREKFDKFLDLNQARDRDTDNARRIEMCRRAEWDLAYDT